MGYFSLVGKCGSDDRPVSVVVEAFNVAIQDLHTLVRQSSFVLGTAPYG